MSHERASIEAVREQLVCEGRVLVIELHRPDALNAMNSQMGNELLHIAKRLEADKELRCVVLTSSDLRSFSVGGDLKERTGKSDAWYKEHRLVFETLVATMLRWPMPAIAAIEGYALGGGFELALLTDFMVASETAIFGLPEVTRGIFPGGGSTQLLPRLIGPARAKELIFSGRRLPAHEALALGVVTQVVPAGSARSKALELAQIIAENAPLAVRPAKQAIDRGLETSLPAGLELSLQYYERVARSADRLEGALAFSEKRKPRWQGK